MKQIIYVMVIAALLLITGCPTEPEGIKVTAVGLDQETVTLTAGASVTLSAEITPENAADLRVSWSSSDEAVVTATPDADDGLTAEVTAISPGSAEVTVTTADGGMTASCEITVTEAPVPVTGITLDQVSVSVYTGNTVNLTATVSPENADNTGVTWTSSDEAVATVAADNENGLTAAVTGESAGSAVITVTAADGGFTAECEVTVSVEDTVAPVITLNGAGEVYILIGSTYTDPGATAEDDVDGDLTSEITVTGSFNSAAEGDYIITYSAADSAGNEAAPVTRTVHVLHPYDARKYEFEQHWGSYRLQPGLFTSPYGVAWAGDGNLLVADGETGRIQSFSTGGVFQEVIFSGSNTIGGISTNASGEIYMALVFSDEIVKLDASGQELLRFGTTGSGDGQFTMPYGALEANGTIYVVDNGNDRIQTFDLNGNYTGQWGTPGTGNGQFDGPYGIVSDGTDLYVSDSQNHRIQKFSADGTYLAQWGSSGTGDNEYNQPSALWYDGTNLIIADGYNNRYQITDTAGNYVTQFGSNGTGGGQFAGAGAVVSDAGGYLYCADLGNERIQKIDTNTAYSFVLEIGGGDFSSDGKFDYPQGICIDDSDILYTADGGNSRIQLFDTQGNYLDEWANPAGWISDVAYCTSSDAVYAANHNSSRTIDKYSTDGTLLGSFGGPGSGDGQFTDDPANSLFLAVDSGGNVFVLESGTARVQKFDSSGSHITTWGEGELSSPKAIGVDAAGNVWIADEGRASFMRYSNDGTFLREDDVHPSGPVFFDPRDNLWWGGYDGQDGNQIMIKMEGNDLNTGLLMLYGDDQSSDVSAWKTAGCAVDSEGNLFVLDLANYIIQKFKPVDGEM